MIGSILGCNIVGMSDYCNDAFACQFLLKKKAETKTNIFENLGPKEQKLSEYMVRSLHLN